MAVYLGLGRSVFDLIGLAKILLLNTQLARMLSSSFQWPSSTHGRKHHALAYQGAWEEM